VNRNQPWIPSAIPFFLFGFSYYLISPPLALHFLSENNELLYAATKYVDSGYFDAYYYIDALMALMSFLIGYFLVNSGTRARTCGLDWGSSARRLPFLLAMIFGVLILYFIVTAGGSGVEFFTGYSTYNILVLGPISTCAFMSAWFVNFFATRRIRLLFLSTFILSSVLLLGLGSRMHFVLGFTALIIGVVSKNRHLLTSFRFHGFILVSFVLVVMVGVARHGGRDFGSEHLIAVFFAESLFSSLSGAMYLENSGGRPMFGVPFDLFASVINFIPSPIYPGKIELMAELTQSEFQESPFGGRSLIANMYPNFGYFYPLYIAAIGGYYGFLSKRAKYSVFYRAIYFSALPILVFFFFREPLFTLGKVMFFNGLLVPLIIAFLLVDLTRKQRPASHARSAS
jgi:hypothetical protein